MEKDPAAAQLPSQSPITGLATTRGVAQHPPTPSPTSNHHRDSEETHYDPDHSTNTNLRYRSSNYKTDRLEREHERLLEDIGALLKRDRAEGDDHEPDTEERLDGNKAYKARNQLMPYAAEFLGTLVFVMFGCGANCQVNLTQNPAIAPMPFGNWTSLALGWGAGLAVGIWISGGGHINPAVTLAMATFRRFPWKRVPGYWLAQTLGGICGAAIVYGNYVRAIDIEEGGRYIRTLKTAKYFGTVPLDYVSNIECFFSEFTGAAILVLGIFAMQDLSKNKWRTGEVPIGIWILFTGIAIAFGAQTSFAHNPARDLGPRMFSAMVGYGRQVFTFRNWYWLYGPVLGGYTGGVVGGGVYDLFLYGDRYNTAHRLQVFNPLRSLIQGDSR